MSTNQTPTTGREKIGLWIMVIFGPIWAETYWKYNFSMFQDLPPFGAALLSAAGAAVGGWIYAKSPVTRIGAAAGGAIAGFGCNYALQLAYGSATSIGGFQRLLCYALGAAPGIIIAVIAIAWLEKRAKKSNPGAG